MRRKSAANVTDTMRDRFREALRGDVPHATLGALAEAMKAEGVDQVTLYHLFAEFQEQTSGDDPRYDAIADTMDCIWGGPWAKGGDLFDRELTDEDVA